ncbi:MAG: hypothetical protein V4610_12925 [Pseudomonadota bacterium]|jgi:hypothetical protein|uniref:Uncharacterized protein n=1 Tax=hydrothermal vent metagenome TaxID=652676 RepID=A0A160TIL7_9ZZZZ|nr:hypothetical protein [Sphingomonas sp.]WEK01724.1 MAG: hypothetical protein P0Y59_08640 [Sphingomonas sp.]
MRAFISKVVTGSMIAGAALMVSACGPKTETTTTNDTAITEMGNDATISDNMTTVDSTSMDGNMMANDTAVVTNETSTTTTTNSH